MFLHPQDRSSEALAQHLLSVLEQAYKQHAGPHGENACMPMHAHACTMRPPPLTRASARSQTPSTSSVHLARRPGPAEALHRGRQEVLGAASRCPGAERRRGRGRRHRRRRQGESALTIEVEVEVQTQLDARRPDSAPVLLRLLPWCTHWHACCACSGMQSPICSPHSVPAGSIFQKLHSYVHACSLPRHAAVCA